MKHFSWPKRSDSKLINLELSYFFLLLLGFNFFYFLNLFFIVDSTELSHFFLHLVPPGVLLDAIQNKDGLQEEAAITPATGTPPRLCRHFLCVWHQWLQEQLISHTLKHFWKWRTCILSSQNILKFTHSQIGIAITAHANLLFILFFFFNK